MGKHRRRRNKIVSVKVAPGDPLGKFRTFFCRGSLVMTLMPVGPRVEAANPKELEEQTAEAIIAATKGQRPS